MEPREQTSPEDFERHVVRALFDDDEQVVPALDYERIDAWAQAVVVQSQDSTSARQPSNSRSSWPGLQQRTLGALFAAALLLLGVVLPRYLRQPRVHLPQRYQTALGQRSTVRLADGSSVMMAPGTTMTVVDDSIDVIGEVYCTVASHQKRPFIVHTKNAVVRVLGTRFAVRRYATEGASRIVVEDGKVALRKVARRMDSDAGDRAPSFSVLVAHTVAVVTDSGISISRGVQTRDVTGWTNGILVFNNIALRDVLTELNRAYGVTIQAPDSALSHQSVTLEVAVADQPITQVLDFIGEALGAHYGKHGDRYVLVPGRTAARGLPRRQEMPKQDQIPQPEKAYGK